MQTHNEKACLSRKSECASHAENFSPGDARCFYKYIDCAGKFTAKEPVQITGVAQVPSLKNGTMSPTTLVRRQLTHSADKHIRFAICCKLLIHSSEGG